MKSITELTNYCIKPGVIYEANDCFKLLKKAILQYSY
jgi:hypothetical protein